MSENQFYYLLTPKIDPDRLSIISDAIFGNEPLLLIGDSGTGKSTLVKYLSNHIGASLVRVEGSVNITEDDLLGRYIIVNSEEGRTVKWVDGPLTDAVRNGKWFLLEEINGIKPSVRLALHSLLESDGYLTLIQNNGEVVKRHPDFRFIGTMNPINLIYVGISKDNMAFKDRFITVNIPYLSPQKEAALLLEYFGYSSSYSQFKKIETTIKSLTLFCEKQRLKFRSGEVMIDFPITTRKLIQIITKAHKMPVSLSFKLLLEGFGDPESLSPLYDLLTQMIPENSDYDNAFLEHGKPPLTNSKSNPGVIKILVERVQNRDLDKVEESQIKDMLNSRSVDYLSIANSFSEEELKSFSFISPFDLRNLLGAKEFIKSRS